MSGSSSRRPLLGTGGGVELARGGGALTMRGESGAPQGVLSAGGTFGSATGRPDPDSFEVGSPIVTPKVAPIEPRRNLGPFRGRDRA
jgi:hypothetical protein